jgi:small nuclear ribonucleoprotein (snRNP)-like protein
MVGGETPYRMLQKAIGTRIKVQLKDLEIYEGKLVKMETSEHGLLGNILLENAKKVNHYEEFLGLLLLRGNHISIIYLQEI